MMKKILMASYGGGHVNLMIPLYKKLRKKYEITYLGLSIATNVLDREGIPYTNYSTYSDLIMDAAAEKFGEELAKRWHVHGKVDLRESVCYLGSCMRDLVNDYGEEKAWLKLESMGRKAFNPIYTARKIIEYVNPELIVTTNSPRTERALTIVGKRMGITTVNIHDHLGFDERHHLSADYVAVMCEITKNNLVRKGHDFARIHITGQPVFDNIIEQMNKFNREELCKKNDLDPIKKYILLGSSRLFTEEIVESIIVTIEKFKPEYEMIIKPHPGENTALYNRLKVNYPNVHLYTDVDIRQLIFISELIIASGESTITLEAVLMKCPVVQLNLSVIANLVPLFQYGVSLEVTKINQLQKIINTALNDKNFRKTFLHCRESTFSTLLAGKSTENVCKLIHKATGNNNKGAK